MYIGIDLGGTNVKGGIVKQSGEILHKDMIPTNAGRSYEEIVNDIAGLINKMLSDTNLREGDIKAIGIGVPGTCNAKDGIIICSSNLGFDYVPICDELKKHFSIPIFVENDANCAALGEYSVLDRDIDNMVFITLGTGVGGGIIINKKLYTGKNGTAAEVGHMVVMEDGEKCNCGYEGCWERYASVTALINQTKEYIEKHPGCAMEKTSADKISGRTAFDMARAGDEGGAEVVRAWIKHVATGIISIINLLQPEILVIGGAISKEGDYLLDPIKKYQNENTYSKIEGCTEIITATLGNDAGLIGSAFLGKGAV